MKKLVATTVLATALTLPALAANVGTAISATTGAAAEKIGQGYENARAKVHQTMAESNVSSTEADLKKGEVRDAAENATDAVKHTSAAADAKSKAAAHKKAAEQKMTTAKGAMNETTSRTTR